jgi:hypothetical protein
VNWKKKDLIECGTHDLSTCGIAADCFHFGTQFAPWTRSSTVKRPDPYGGGVQNPCRDTVPSRHVIVSPCLIKHRNSYHRKVLLPEVGGSVDNVAVCVRLESLLPLT